MIGLVLTWLASPVFAGGGPCGYLVVYDPTDTNSLAVANYYQQVRHLPEGNMVPYVFPQLPGATAGGVNATNFVTYLRGVIRQRGLEGHFNGLTLAGISPIYTDRGGWLNLLCLLYQSPNYPNVNSMPNMGVYNGAFRRDGATTELRSDVIVTNALYNTRGQYWCVSYVGWTGASGLGPQEVFNYLDRARAADGHGQGGTIYCPYSGDDTRYGLRGGAYVPGVGDSGGEIANDAVPVWDALGIRYAQPNKPQLTGLGCMSQCGDNAGEIIGSTGIASGETGNRYLPGAYADHGTSAAGVLVNFFTSQSPCAYWLHKGAYGTSGMTTEPFAIPEKFPHPHLHTHLRNGASLGEAMWESVALTEEIAFLGDPLMQPYATFPVVAISKPVTDGMTVSNTCAIAASAAVGAVTTPTTLAPATLEPNLDLAVDGHVVNIDASNETIAVTRTNGGTGFVLDTTTLADGWHELRVIAYNNNPVRTQGEATRTLVVNNHGQSVALSGPVSVDYAGGTAGFTATPAGMAGATNLTLQANGRTLARLPVGGGTTHLPVSVFGFQGTTTVHAVSWLDNGQQVWSAPWNIVVTWTPKSPANVTLSANRTAQVSYFVNTATNAFSWDTTPPTASLGWTNNLVFNTTTLAAVAPSDYTALPGYEVNTYYWAATTNLYEFAVNDLLNSGVKGPPRFGSVTNLTLWVDGQPAGSALAGRTVPVKLAAGAHALKFRFAVTDANFCPAVFVRDVNESGFYASYSSVPPQNSGGLYLVMPQNVLFTATNATPPTITAGPAATSSLNSNKVSLAVSATTGNPGPLTYTWAKVAGPVEGGVTFSASGTPGASNTVATFGMAGDYRLQVAVNDGTAVTFGQLTVTVDNAPESLTISPAVATIRSNMVVAYQVTVVDGFGNTSWPPATNLAWSASAGTVLGAGLGTNMGSTVIARYLPPAGVGTNTITFAHGGGTGTVLAVVIRNVPPTLVSPQSAVQAFAPNVIGNTVGSIDDLGADVNFSWRQVSGPVPLAFSTNNCAAAATNTAVYTQLGVYQLQVIGTDADGASVTSAVLTVTITNALPAGILTIPCPATVQTNSTLPFTAKAYDQFGSEMPDQALINSWWSSVGTIDPNTGFFTAPATTGFYARGVQDSANSLFFAASSDLTVTNLAVAALPAFVPGGGRHLNPTNVALVCATPGASIYYTTDGSVPSTTNGALYVNPIPVTNGITRITARACKSGLGDSGGVPATYTIPLTHAAAPGGVTATALNANQIDLVWTNPVNNEAGFKIERATDSAFTGGLVTQFVAVGIGSAASIGVAPGMPCYFNDTRVASNTAYYYRVRAYNGYGDTPNSAVASATTAPPFGPAPLITSA